MAKYINDIIKNILNGKTSKFEAITYINTLVDDDTIDFFLEDLKENYDNIAHDFIMLFSENEIIKIFNLIETDLDFMFENGLSPTDIISIKNYIKLYFNMKFYFCEKTNKTVYEIPKSYAGENYASEIAEILEQSPRVLFNKISLLGNYLISFDLSLIYKNKSFDYTDQQVTDFENIANVFSKNENKIGKIKLLKSIYLFLISKQTSISEKLNNFEIDLSDTKAIDKILYLQKLGVIDFLRGQQPFNTSVNSLASVLTAITGEKTVTLQPMLNPMLSKKVDDKNNPFNSNKAVERVEKQLINIGFNLNETN